MKGDEISSHISKWSELYASTMWIGRIYETCYANRISWAELSGISGIIMCVLVLSRLYVPCMSSSLTVGEIVKCLPYGPMGNRA